MQSIYQSLYEESCKRAKHVIWVVSDLQQAQPENTARCLNTAMSDYCDVLGAPAERVWYLGDAVEGTDRDRLLAMCDLQEKAFGSLQIPLSYVTGNHDYDPCRANPTQPAWMPFWEMVRDHPGWETTKEPEDYWFRSSVGDFGVYFFSDHIDRNNRWLVSHGIFRHGGEFYPYTDADAHALRERMAAEACPLITASHYGFFGGNRESLLLSKLLPLPPQVRLHLHGHSHIGDFAWGKKNAYRRIAWVDWHDIPQVDVASFENVRGAFCRSVLLHIYEDHSLGLFFRNHDRREFCEAYFPAREPLPAKQDACVAENISIKDGVLT
jgi:calcineurin-like phosphoesterase family protein